MFSWVTDSLDSARLLRIFWLILVTVALQKLSRWTVSGPSSPWSSSTPNFLERTWGPRPCSYTIPGRTENKATGAGQSQATSFPDTWPPPELSLPGGGVA